MREFKIIEEAISKFSLDLKGLNILTEAASGNYVWTPIIAALAGGNVFAFSKNSRYGSFNEIAKNTKNLAKKLGIEKRIFITNILSPEIIKKSNIITNLGFLRPLNEEKLKYCDSKVVIPLMWETWEYREEDLDLSYCFKKGIPVLGTNESHKDVATFKYLGLVVKKILLNQNIEIFKSKIIVLGKGKFKKEIISSLKKEGAIIIDYNLECIKNYKFIDAIIIADNITNTNYIGNKGIINCSTLKKINKDILIVHISGNISVNEIIKEKLHLFPNNIAPIKYMSITTDFVGPKPLIDLHTAGLKVGKIMNDYNFSEKNFENVIKKSLKDPLCQDFSIAQKRKFFK